MRALILSFLTTLIVLTSAGLGLARGMMPADQGIVICQGHAAVTIWIDANGKEVEHQHLCPEEGSFFKQGALDGPLLTAPERRFIAFAEQTPPLPEIARPLPVSPARGPPFLV